MYAPILTVPGLQDIKSLSIQVQPLDSYVLELTLVMAIREERD